MKILSLSRTLNTHSLLITYKLLSPSFKQCKNNLSAAVSVTCATTSPKGSSVRGSADSAEHCHPLSHGGVEVVVIGDGGDPEAGVVLRRGVGPIAVACSLGDAGVVCEFGCFLILALHTAHYLYSADNKRNT